MKRRETRRMSRVGLALLGHGRGHNSGSGHGSNGPWRRRRKYFVPRYLRKDGTPVTGHRKRFPIRWTKP